VPFRGLHKPVQSTARVAFMSSLLKVSCTLTIRTWCDELAVQGDVVVGALPISKSLQGVGMRHHVQLVVPCILIVHLHFVVLLIVLVAVLVFLPLRARHVIVGLSRVSMQCFEEALQSL